MVKDVSAALFSPDVGNCQARTGRGINGLPKVSGHARPLYALRVGHPPNGLTAVWGWPALWAGGLRPSSSPLDTPSRTGLAIATVRQHMFRNNITI
jgi:hypothetical protein